MNDIMESKFYSTILEEEVTVRKYLQMILWNAYSNEESSILRRSNWFEDLKTHLVLSGHVTGFKGKRELHYDSSEMDNTMFELINSAV